MGMSFLHKIPRWGHNGSTNPTGLASRARTATQPRQNGEVKTLSAEEIKALQDSGALAKKKPSKKSKKKRKIIYPHWT